MFVTESEYSRYGCCGPKSVVLNECTFDEDLWNKIWTDIKNFLDTGWEWLIRIQLIRSST